MPIPNRERSRLRRTPRDAAEEDKIPYAPQLSPRMPYGRYDEIAAEKARRQAQDYGYLPHWNQSAPFVPPPGVPPFAMPLSPRASISPPRVLSPVQVRALSPPRRRTAARPGSPQATRELVEAEQRWLAEEDRMRASMMMPVEPHRRVIRSAMPDEMAPLPRELEKHDEAMMMARWAQLVESRVESTERVLAAATSVAAEAGRSNRMRESLAEREKELAHENMLRDVENAKAAAESERRTAFQGRVYTTKLEQGQAEELAHQREYFERDMLDREKRQRDAEAHRRDAEEAWRLRRKEREDDLREADRVQRAEKHHEKASEDMARAQDLHRVAVALDQAHQARENALAYREAERDDQRRQRMRREAELEAATREEAELADNMISNLDRAYREQEQAAAMVRETEARQVDLNELQEESRTRAPFRAARAEEHLKLVSSCEREQIELAERNAHALSMAEKDMERRARASYRLQRELDATIQMTDGAARSLRGVDMRGMHGGPVGAQTDTTRRAKLGSEAVDEQNQHREHQSEANSLANAYSDAEYTVSDGAPGRARPEHSHVHRGEEYEFSHTAAGAAGPVPIHDRALQYRLRPEGRLMANVLTPREEMEVAREAKKAIEREEKVVALDAARTSREQAEYSYSARKVHYAQLQSRHEQYLGEATPALAAAQAAASSLCVEPLTELFLAPDPTAAVKTTLVAAHVLLNKGLGDASYEAARKRLNFPELFIQDLRNFDCDNLPEAALEKVSSMMRALDVDEVLMQSPVSGTILLWVANVSRYNEVYRLVRPVMIELQEAAMALEQMDEARRAAAKKLSYTLAWRE